LLRENIFACYIKELRGTSTYKKHCPTTNIKWHYVDARFSEGSKYNLENIIADMFEEEGLNKIFETENISVEEIEKIVNKSKKNMGGERLFKEIVNFLYLFIEDIDKGIDYFFEIATPSNSLIMKQLNKLSPTLKDMNKWKEYIKSYNKKIYNDDLIKINKNASDHQWVQELRANFYKLLLEDDYNGIYSFIQDEFNHLLLKMEIRNKAHLDTTFLDLYYVLRTFKIPKGDVNSFLSLSYFGDFHTSYIIHLLTNIIGYYEVIDIVKNDKGDNYRCSIINSELNINDIALEYGVNIKPKYEPKYEPKYDIPKQPKYEPKYEPKYDIPKQPKYEPKYEQPKYEPKYKQPKYTSTKRSFPVKRKSPARKSPVRKSPARKPPARKSPVRKPPARKSPVRKSPVRKPPARKSPAKRTARKRR
jgi:hypothetical protein